MSKILVLGATGAMATYLIPELLKKGNRVTGISLDDVISSDPNLTYIKADATDKEFLNATLAEGYDAIVDFMIYNSKELFEEYYELFLKNCSHYIFLSTYRVYAGECPITENSLRILEMDRPDDFVMEREYSIYKAQEEDVLRASGHKNFTIVRPAITYSQCRFQLTTLEAPVFIYRMKHGKTVILPEGAMERQATMTWAGDVAKMLSAIILNPKAYGETYTVSTAEHHTWREVAEMYKRIGGLEYIVVDDETFIALVGGSFASRQQLKYDRFYDRVVDNSKILDLMGITQEDLMPLEKGLRYEFESLTEERLARIGYNERTNPRMDAYLEK
jgi:nucleoside-diphosphate-sugar epimerase